MPYFRRKPSPPIEANQYLEGKPVPNGVQFRELENGMRIAYVTTHQGVKVSVRPGEWIVTERGGRYYPISDDEFQRLYEYTDET